MLLAGCALSEPLAADNYAEDASIEELNEPLNSLIVFPDATCTSQQKTRVEQAAEIALAQVNGSQRGAMLDCLKEASVSMEENAFPEKLLVQLREDKATQVRCTQEADGTNAHAPVGSDQETVNLDYDFLNEACAIGGCASGVSNVARIASVFLHEIVHNKGYTHPKNSGGTQEYRYTLPEQVEQCSLAISSGQTAAFPRGTFPRPNGAMRSESPTRVELAPVGTHGGSPFGVDSCGTSQFARGLGLRTGTKVDRISLRCAQGSSTSVSTTPNRGGTGGTAASLDCPTTSFMVGVGGRAADGLDAIAPICATSAVISASGTATTSLTQAGGSGGYAFTRLCPAGMAVKALAGRSATRVDELSLICQKFSDTKTPAITWSVEYGTKGGDVHRERCATGAVIGLFGQSGSVIDRVGAECQALVRNASGALARSGGVSGMSGQGGRGGSNWAQDRCPPGEALTGFLVNHADKIDRLLGLCANVDAVDRGTVTTHSALANHGGSGGLASSASCLGKSFVTGWEISHSGTVKSIKLMCQSF
jgi:hypothetical protein